MFGNQVVKKHSALHLLTNQLNAVGVMVVVVAVPDPFRGMRARRNSAVNQ